MKVKSESEVAQLCPTLSDPMDCSPPGSSIHGIFQARVLDWGAIAFSIVMIDTFTEWIEGFPTWTEKAEEVVRKLLHEVIPRFGLPRSL